MKIVGSAEGNWILKNICAGVRLKLRPTFRRTRRVPDKPSMVFRMTAGRPATKPIITMVVAERPKITRKSGYISTVGADAMAATQVSVARRRRSNLCMSAPMEMPNTASKAAAARHSLKVSTKRSSMCSSTMTRSKLAAICEGIGTMKRLMKPKRIRTSMISAAAEKRADAERGRHEADAGERERGHLPPRARASASSRPRVASSRKSAQTCAT